MRSPEGIRLSLWYKRADRTLDKLRGNNAVVLVAKRKRMPVQTVTIVRYDLSNAYRNPKLKTRTITSAGRSVSGARPVDECDVWEIPFEFNNPGAITGELGMMWCLRISFRGCSPVVGLDFTTARGYACSGSFIFDLYSDYKLTTNTAKRMISNTGWCMDELASGNYVNALRVMNVSDIDNLPAMFMSGDRSIARAIRLLREQLDVKIQQEFFQPIVLDAVLELPNSK